MLKLIILPCYPVASMFQVVLLIMLPSVLQQASRSSVQASPTTFNNKTDGDTLLALKANLGNQFGALASWNKFTDFCRWQGVSCSLKHKHRITALNLSSEGLTGTVPPSIGNLTFLKTLDLSWNNLHGEIPSAIGLLSRLRYLDLSNNSFHGEVNANLKNCTSLESIYLHSNRLMGEIPAWLEDFSNLKAIYLQKNNFTGIIPPSVSNLSKLQEIYFNSNQLHGPIPENLGRLNRLEFLALQENHLSGTIPTTLLNLSSLTHFSVAMNELHGTLSSDMGNRLRKLQYLLLAINHFTGSLPSSLANITTLFSLDITSNNFAGSLPPEIGKICPEYLSFESNQLVATTAQDWEFMTFLTNCTRLRIFAIDRNMLGGMLPSSVANLSAQLQALYLGFNEISGKIPLGISNLVGLNQLQFSNNRFTGVIPESIGRLNSLQVLGLENNSLSGLMPSSLGNLTLLQRLYTDGNTFEGPLPTSLGNLQEIVIATFDNNKFTGPLPMGIFNMSSLSYALDLSDNYFIGPLPPEVGSLTKLSYLDIARNNLSGPLPDSLSSCQSLIGLWLYSNSFNSSIPASISKMKGLMLLNLTKNALSGVIPQEIGFMGGLQALDLSHNNLSGHIPESFENMSSLYQLDLSFNNLDGKVPSHGVFSNVTGFSFDGNIGLCGGISELHLPPCPPKRMDHRKMKLHFSLKVTVPIAGIVLCLTSVLICVSFKKKVKGQAATMAGIHFMDDKYPRVSYAELVQGTNGFDTTNLIGTGRYGSVYKCNLLLKNTLTTVAVKVFDLQQSGSSKSFIAECEALNKIRHRNLINIITCCSSTDSNQHDFKALVFEFMPNGSLNRCLHLDVHASPERQGLTLTQRLNIAVDVADALDYLHNNCEPPIVHCDLKPSNILLNQDLVAQVGDFGLAKIFSDSASEQQINSKSSIGIRGTIGYVAPEYGEGGQVSPCGDVYSFGIVILELFTGIVPTHDIFRDGLTLQKHVENAYPGMLLNIVDPVIASTEEAYASNLQSGRSAMEEISEVMLSITKIALSCSKQAPTERMCMSYAAAEVRRIRDNHLKRRQIEEVTVQ
ncbi:hypothetical protein ACP70R_008415 [Stipagrostis hirtigluma subsp. patula]